jgi:hypothetical protein
LRIASHVANGGKHFVVTRHDSVRNLEKTRYAAEDYVADGYFEDPSLVHLAPDEAIALGVVDSIEAISLAQKTIDFWSAHPSVA